MVSVLGSYKPATASPDSLTTLLAITTLVLPRPFSIALATFATLASLTFVRSLIAPRKSPACSLARVSGVIGSEVFSAAATVSGLPLTAANVRVASPTNSFDSTLKFAFTHP